MSLPELTSIQEKCLPYNFIYGVNRKLWKKFERKTNFQSKFSFQNYLKFYLKFKQNKLAAVLVTWEQFGCRKKKDKKTFIIQFHENCIISIFSIEWNYKFLVKFVDCFMVANSFLCSNKFSTKKMPRKKVVNLRLQSSTGWVFYQKKHHKQVFFKNIITAFFIC